MAASGVSTTSSAPSVTSRVATPASTSRVTTDVGSWNTYDVVISLLDSPASGGSFGTYQDALSEADVAAMTLHIGERSFDLADATHAFSITQSLKFTLTHGLFPRASAGRKTKRSPCRSPRCRSLPPLGRKRRGPAETTMIRRGVLVHPHREHRRGAELHRPSSAKADRPRRARSAGVVELQQLPLGRRRGRDATTRSAHHVAGADRRRVRRWRGLHRRSHEFAAFVSVEGPGMTCMGGG